MHTIAGFVSRSDNKALQILPCCRDTVRGEIQRRPNRTGEHVIDGICTGTYSFVSFC